MCVALLTSTDPVLLCNELGVAPTPSSTHEVVQSCGKADFSIKDAVRTAQSNNIMGLICTSRLLELIPALIEAIKEAGLVLIVDRSNDNVVGQSTTTSILDLPKGVDGGLFQNAILKFKDTIEQ